MKWTSCIIILTVVLIGCTKYVEVEKEKIVYQTETTIEYINITNSTCEEASCVCDVDSDRSIKLELIRRISFLEGQQDELLNMNNSNCVWDLNQSDTRLRKAEEELCDEWNSSWC